MDGESVFVNLADVKVNGFTAEPTRKDFGSHTSPHAEILSLSPRMDNAQGRLRIF
jgi:hypothetical protein